MNSKRIFIILCIFLTGCATIKSGRYQEIEINSNVAGALIELDGVEIGRTPFKGDIKRNKTGKIGTIKVSNPGYAASEVKILKRENSPWFGSNIFFSPPLTLAGIGADIMSGSVGGGRRHGGDLGILSDLTETSLVVSAIGAGVTVTGAAGTALYIFAGAKAGVGTAALAIGAAAPPALGSLIDKISGAAWKYSPSSYYVQLKEEGQSSMNFLNETAILYFATVNHSQIAIDAGNDGGEYVEALADLMETKKDREIAKRDINEALEESKGNQVLFGDALVAKFRK